MSVKLRILAQGEPKLSSDREGRGQAEVFMLYLRQWPLFYFKDFIYLFIYLSIHSFILERGEEKEKGEKHRCERIVT